MSVTLQPGDVAALAALPEIARRAITADLDRQQDVLRQRREREQADARAAEKSRQDHPIASQIAAENTRQREAWGVKRGALHSPHAPRPGPRRGGTHVSALDQAAAARCPALQHIRAFNDRDVAVAQAKQAAESVARVEQLEAQAAALRAAAQAEEERAAAVARTRQLERAIVAMAEEYIRLHPDV